MPISGKSTIAVALGSVCLLVGFANAAKNDDNADDRNVVIRRVILPARAVADAFGKRIAQSHMAMQVTVANPNKTLDLIIQDASIDLTKALSPERVAMFRKRVDEVNSRLALSGSNAYKAELTTKASSVDLQLLQGVAQKGQHYDARNQAYRAIIAVGTIGAGLVGAAGLGPVLPLAVAAWTGPMLSAFTTLFPDLTVDELIRLNDQAYTANMVVPREKSRVFVVFLPLDLILTEDEKKEYWHTPPNLISIASNNSGRNAAGLDLSQIEVEVDYKFIIPVTDVPPNITDIAFESSELDNFAAKLPVHGAVVGRFLDGASVSVLEGTDLGLTITPDTARQSGDNRLYFVITPQKVVPAGTRLTFQLSRDKQVSSFSKILTHHMPSPTLTSIDPVSGTVKTDVPVTIVGSGFVDGDVSITFDGSSDLAVSGIQVNNLKVTDSSHIAATFSIDEKAKIGARQAQIHTSGGLSGVKTFTVAATQ